MAKEVVDLLKDLRNTAMAAGLMRAACEETPKAQGRFLELLAKGDDLMYDILVATGDQGHEQMKACAEALSKHGIHVESLDREGATLTLRLYGGSAAIYVDLLDPQRVVRTLPTGSPVSSLNSTPEAFLADFLRVAGHDPYR